MENHFFSSSSSFPPTHIVEAVGERETVNNSRPWYPRGIVSERTIPVRHGFGLGVVQPNREALVCKFCLKGFRNGRALGGHLKAHKKEREVAKLREQRESLLLPAIDNLFRQLLARRALLSNDNHLGGGSRSGNNSSVHPALMLGVPDTTMSVVTRATPYKPFRGNTGYTSPSRFQGLSCVPFKYGGGGGSSSSRSTYPFNGAFFTRGLNKMNTAMFPPLTPNRFRTENTLPSNNCISHALSDVDLELTLGRSKSSTYPFNGVFLTQGLTKMKTAMSPPPTLKRFRSENTLPSNNCSSHDVDLDLTLGPSKSIGGGSNNNKNNVNSSFNGEDTRGNTNQTRVVRPRVSRFHYAAGNPLDSITGNNSAYRNTNLYREFFSLQENGSGSSQSKSRISKGKDKVMVPEDDLASLQESGSGSTQPESLMSKGKDKVMVSEDDLFALQENGSGSGSSTQSKSLISKGKDKVMVPEDDLFALQENGSGSGSTQSESLISKGKDKAMVPEDDLASLQESGSGSTQPESVVSEGNDKIMVPEDDDNKGLGTIRWLNKKKISA